VQIIETLKIGFQSKLLKQNEIEVNVLHTSFHRHNLASKLMNFQHTFLICVDLHITHGFCLEDVANLIKNNLFPTHNKKSSSSANESRRRCKI